MRVIGKSPPVKDELAAAAEMGFDAVELYLEPDHLDAYDESLSACLQADVEIASVHTPHVDLDKAAYFEIASELADDVGAEVVCVHSTEAGFAGINDIRDETDFDTRHGFENDRETSLADIEADVFDEGLELTLDVAHLYAGVGPVDYLKALEHLLSAHGDSIPLVHFTDATLDEDNLPLGEGDLDLERVGEIVKEYHDGPVVMEVMPEHQEAALEAFREY